MSDYNPYPPRGTRPTRPDVEPLWTLKKGERVAEAKIYPHVLGFELWITDSQQDGFARTQVHRTEDAAELDATETYERLRHQAGFEPA